MRQNRSLRSLAALALVAGLAACGGDEPPPETDPIESPAPEATGDDEETEGDAASDDAAADPEASTTDDPDAEPSPADEPADTEPLSGSPSTGETSEDPTAGVLAVTDVRVASHDGFDRIVFDIDDGDDGGTVGWHISYVDAPTSQGSGHDVAVEGEAYLSVSIVGATLPPELPAGIEAYTQDTDGPAGGAVTEIVFDSIYEGHHLFFVGLDAQRPYVVQRLSDPQRVVIDLFDA